MEDIGDGAAPALLTPDTARKRKERSEKRLYSRKGGLAEVVEELRAAEALNPRSARLPEGFRTSVHLVLGSIYIFTPEGIALFHEARQEPTTSRRLQLLGGCCGAACVVALTLLRRCIPCAAFALRACASSPLRPPAPAALRRAQIKQNPNFQLGVYWSKFICDGKGTKYWVLELNSMGGINCDAKDKARMCTWALVITKIPNASTIRILWNLMDAVELKQHGACALLSPPSLSFADGAWTPQAASCACNACRRTTA